jgi:amidohydrolase
MASADEIYIKIVGKGGHAAMPHRCNDTVLAASQVIVSMQQLISRIGEAKIPSVLSFGKLIAEGATNVIPNEVCIEGTFRTYNEEWRFKAHEKIREIAQNTAKAFQCNAETNVIVGFPFLNNDTLLTKKMKTLTTEILGEENTLDLDIEPIAEDFAYFSQEYSASMFRLGVKPENEEIFSLHHPKFNPDEKALEHSLSALSWLSLNLANN